jgi:CRISPR/Cas system-associated exonuclease Cas4 (RecB family)
MPGSARVSAGRRNVEAVTVTETVDAVVVSVMAGGGRTAVRRARRTEQGLHEALAAAVCELVDPGGSPVGIRSIERSDAFAALTVCLEGADGTIRVGASVVAAGYPFAFAQAVWVALQS